MPATLGDVQHELNIRPQASLIVQVKNPENPEPQRNMPSNFPGFAGLGEGHRPEYPEELMVGFENLKSDKHKRYSSNEDLPRMMEIEGTELLLIGADYDVVNELHGTSKGARDRGTWDCSGADQWVRPAGPGSQEAADGRHSGAGRTPQARPPGQAEAQRNVRGTGRRQRCSGETAHPG